jgi:hypothetical protein
LPQAFGDIPDGHRWDSSPKIRFAPDSPLEGTGFEPSVPLRWSDGSRPHRWYDAVRRRDDINIEEGGDPNAKVASETFGRALQQFGRRALVNLIALMGNYAGTAALLTVFDMQLDPDQPLPLPQL